MRFRGHPALAACLLVGGLAAPAQAEPRVHPSATAVMPLAPGARVPAVSVTTVQGETVDLAERVRERGALLVFYRGGW